ncbi:MAG: hypothetical protein N2C14_31025, partial [Planctomycetales bacterium]
MSRGFHQRTQEGAQVMLELRCFHLTDYWESHQSFWAGKSPERVILFHIETPYNIQCIRDVYWGAW